jgi:hypothetical protein
MPIAKKSTTDGAVPAVGTVTIDSKHGRIVLDWDTVNLDTYPDFSHSEVERSDDGSTGWAVVKRLTASGWTDAKRGNLEQKYYRVRHFDSSGNPGAYSAVVNATTPRIKAADVDSDEINSRTMAEGAVFEFQTMKFTWKEKANGSKKYKKDNVLSEPLTIKNPLNLPIQVGFMCTMYLSVKGGSTRDEKPFGTISLNIVRSDQKNPTNAGRLKGGGTTLGTGSANFIIPAEGGITLRVSLGATAKLPSSGSIQFQVAGRIAAFVPKKG